MGGLGGLAKYSLAAAAPMMFQEPEAAAKEKELKARNFEFAYNPVANVNQGYTGAHTGERLHFNPTYTEMPVTAAGGGLMDIQPIGAMSQQNQSQMRPAYAQGGVSDMAVNPYTGSENFAEGGDTAAPPPKAVRPVEQDPYNTMTGQSADMYKYLMGQMPARAPAPAPVAAPAPVKAAAIPQTIVAKSPGNGFISNLFGGASQGDSTIRPYDFDPVTGTFTQLPIVDPAAQSDEIDVNPYGIPAPSAAPFNPNITPWDMGGTGMAQGGIASLAQGGPSHLGDYSDGGRLLRGPGDGVSDSIPASIGNKRPARLADGEFVVPARIVSELGNGSTEAGARKLYAMMDRVQKARAKTTGKDRVATDTKASRLLPV